MNKKTEGNVKKTKEVLLERNSSKNYSALITIMFFIGIQPVLYVFFGNWLFVAYVTGFVGAGIYSVIKTKELQAFVSYPIQRSKNIVKESAKTLETTRN